MKKNIKIKTVLHLTPNLSGGLGRVLFSTLNFFSTNSTFYNHEIIILEKNYLKNNPLIEKRFSIFKKKIHVNKSNQFIKNKIIESDIIQLEYWNHPLIYKFITQFVMPKSRLIICSHINGFFRPQILNKNVVKFSDYFLCTTKASKKNKLFKENKYLRKKLKFITFPVDFNRLKKIKKKKHNGFNLTYIGTLDYSKLHNNFIKISSSIKIPNLNIIVCGTGSDFNLIIKQSLKYNNKRFRFTGFKENIKSILEKTDIFGYPLNSHHFGSGEQVLIEAMYSKIPVVAFSNPAEREIIENGVTGYLAKNDKEYVKIIETLSRKKKLRQKIGNNAHEYVLKNFSPSDNFKKLQNMYDLIMKNKKKNRLFQSNIFLKNKGNKLQNLGAELFLESLADNSYEFKTSFYNNGKRIIKKINNLIKNSENELTVLTKGSLFQYLYFFPKDKYLNFWAGLIKNKKSQINSRLKSINYNLSRKYLLRAYNADKYNKEFKYYLKNLFNK